MVIEDYETGVRSILYRYPLYDYKSKVWAFTKDNKTFVGWEQDSFGRFDLEIVDGICYVLHIYLNGRLRGKGFGEQLYLIIEQIAKEFGCHLIEQTPSGTTHLGKSRREYLKEKLGYSDTGKTVTKVLNFSKTGILESSSNQTLAQRLETWIQDQPKYKNKPPEAYDNWVNGYQDALAEVKKILKISKSLQLPEQEPCPTAPQS